jgi:Ran-binding protein 3
VESGEEKEKTVFAADASLFEFLDGGWNERGKGEVKVNVPEDTNRRPRLVMRSKGNLRLLLNANILPDMKITKMDNRGVTFVCANAIGDGKVGLATYALKLRDAQFARDFLSTVEAKKGKSAEPPTPETSPKAAVDRPSEEVAPSSDGPVKGDGIEAV